MKWRTALLVLGSLAGLATDAGSTTGGPSSTEVLGWNPKTSRVFFHVVTENDPWSSVGYFDLRSDDPAAIHWMKWPYLPSGQEQERLRKFRRWLSPLERRSPTVLPLVEPQISEVDTVRWMQGHSHSRTWVRAQFDVGAPIFEVATFGALRYVVRVGSYMLPDHSASVEILAFKGDPTEMIYEVQVPVLVRNGEQGVRRIAFDIWSGGKSRYSE